MFIHLYLKIYKLDTIFKNIKMIQSTGALVIMFRNFYLNPVSLSTFIKI